MNQSSTQHPRLDGVWWLALISVIGLFVVNIAGFIDTETGSALGCGHQWPLCNNSVIPSAWNVHTIIEFMHRAVVGLITLLLLVTSVGAWRRYGRWIEVRVFVSITMGFVLLEALLGAVGVLVGDPPAVLAIHLGVSLMAFSGIVMLAIVLAQIQKTSHSQKAHDESMKHESGGWSEQRQGPRLRLATTGVSKHFRTWAFIAWGYTLVALYVGAYIASIGAGGAFRGFPFPTESYKQVGKYFLFDVLHRSIALGLLVLCIGMFVAAYRVRQTRRDLYKGTLIALILVCMQGLSGGLLVLTHLSIFAFLLHVSIVSCLFVTLGYVSMQLLPEPASRHLHEPTRTRKVGYGVIEGGRSS